MRKWILAIALLPFHLMAQSYVIDMDTANPGEQHVIDRVFTGNNPDFTLNCYQNKSALSLSNYWSMVFSYGYSQTSTNGMVRIDGSWSTSNQCAFTSTNAFSRAGEYYFSIYGTNSSTTRTRTFARGNLIIEYEPGTTTDSTLTLTRTINWDTMTLLGTSPWTTGLTTNIAITVSGTNFAWSYTNGVLCGYTETTP